MSTPDTQMNGDSLNVIAQRKQELKQLFPGVFTETRNKFFCKLPRWFTIPAPVGPYTPDRAVVLEVTALYGEQGCGG